ncbi:MGMT family protein [Cellulomonas endophytica]|uniref:MGMT family protein n=1 Tax=Cellulomonas endophytica TaxID=2494735 RepID=UPI001010DFDA|nr:MGMT family protein [Cellulomonas endophytica]
MDEEYLEAVLDVVAGIPSGRAMSYGAVAEAAAERLEAAGSTRRGGPRQAGQVLARAGSGVAWWRVVDASGRPPARHASRALGHLREEATPLVADGTRVALRTAGWFPPPPTGADPTRGSAGDDPHDG